MKWNANNISLFLQLYQQFPALWNIKDENYRNKSLRDTVFNQLMSELEENQLLGQMDNKQLKAKIKSIEDVYRTELNEMEKSKKSGCGPDDVYVPKLTWFNEACFLSELLATRSSHSNLDASQTIAEKHEDGNSIDQDEPEIGGEITPQSSEIMKPPEQPKKTLKKSDRIIPDK